MILCDIDHKFVSPLRDLDPPFIPEEIRHERCCHFVYTGTRGRGANVELPTTTLNRVVRIATRNTIPLLVMPLFNLV